MMITATRRSRSIPISVALLLWAAPLLAGPFAPPPGDRGSTAVAGSSSDLIAWATGWEALEYGERVTSSFQTPDLALGAATGDSFDIVSLGDGGSITLTFDQPVRNGPGWDFAVFENGFSDSFLELAIVSVSSNGSDFVAFDCYSLTESAVSEFGTLDATDLDGFAGKYRLGYGTPFDLSDLALSDEVISGLVNLSAITHIRLQDVVGDGSVVDARSNPVYDPYPTNNSAGFDLEAVGLRYENGGGINSAPGKPEPGTPYHRSVDVALAATLEIDSTSDPDSEDLHLLTRWQVAETSTFATGDMILDLYSHSHRLSLFIPEGILDPGTTYYWRTRILDGSGSASGWSDTYEFDTTAQHSQNPITAIDWDNDGFTDNDVKTVRLTNSDGNSSYLGIEAGSNVQAISAMTAYAISAFSAVDFDDSPDSFPAGLFGVRLVPVDASADVLLTVYLEESAPTDAAWYRYDTLRGWQRDVYAEFNTTRDRIRITMGDSSGDTGDNDGSRNNVIVYTGGLGIDAAETVEQPPTESDDAGIGEQSGCFVATIEAAESGSPQAGWALPLLLGSVWSLLVGYFKRSILRNRGHGLDTSPVFSKHPDAQGMRCGLASPSCSSDCRAQSCRYQLSDVRMTDLRIGRAESGFSSPSNRMDWQTIAGG